MNYYVNFVFVGPVWSVDSHLGTDSQALAARRRKRFSEADYFFTVPCYNRLRVAAFSIVVEKSLFLLTFVVFRHGAVLPFAGRAVHNRHCRTNVISSLARFFIAQLVCDNTVPPPLTCCYSTC